MDHSDKVGALVLMSTYTRRPERSSFAIDTMIRTVDEGATFDSLMELMQSWCLPEDYFKKLALAKPAQRRCNGNGKRAAEGFKAQKLALDLFDSHDHLDKITAPTLIIHGTRDAVVPIAGSRQYAAAHANVRLVEVDDDHPLQGSLPRIEREVLAFFGIADAG